MKKFIIHTRAIPGRPKEESPFYLVEVEGEIITALEDPSVMLLPNREFRFKIMEPKFLHDSYGPAIYYSHSIYHTVEEARSVAESMVLSSFEFELRKHGTEINYVEVLEKCKKIEEIPL